MVVKTFGLAPTLGWGCEKTCKIAVIFYESQSVATAYLPLYKTEIVAV